MRSIALTGRFKRDYSRVLRADPDIDTILQPLLEQLAKGEPLAVHHSDHPLSGNWKGYRDCHVRPDLLLIYSRTADELTLARLGSHSDLF